MVYMVRWPYLYNFNQNVVTTLSVKMTVMDLMNKGGGEGWCDFDCVTVTWWGWRETDCLPQLVTTSSQPPVSAQCTQSNTTTPLNIVYSSEQWCVTTLWLVLGMTDILPVSRLYMGSGQETLTSHISLPVTNQEEEHWPTSNLSADCREDVCP